MTSRPIIPGRAYNVDGVTIIAVNPVTAIIEYLRILYAHQIKPAIKSRVPT